MKYAKLGALIDQIRKTSFQDDGFTPSDDDLLDGFVAHADEAAFGELVQRHAAMVMSVCRRVLGNQHDAEDAFQATFLVLARKARSIAQRQLLSNWLYGVDAPKEFLGGTDISVCANLGTDRNVCATTDIGRAFVSKA